MSLKYVSFLAMRDTKDNSRRPEKKLVFCMPENLLFFVCVVFRNN